MLLAVGDEDIPCLETNLMLKSALPNAGLWICPNTGHAVNLEEPAAFNAHVENFLGAVERGSWRRGYPRRRLNQTRDCSDKYPQLVRSSLADQERADLIRLHHN